MKNPGKANKTMKIDTIKKNLQNEHYAYCNLFVLQSHGSIGCNKQKI